MYSFKNKFVRVSIILSLIYSSLLFLTLALAHHSHTAFDGDTQLELNGIVVEMDYRNPHIEIILRVGEDDPTTAEVEGDVWEIDTVSATGANRHKLYADTIQPGHPLKIIGWPAKNGDLVMYAGTLVMFEDPEAAIAANQSFAGDITLEPVQADTVSGDSEEPKPVTIISSEGSGTNAPATTGTTGTTEQANSQTEVTEIKRRKFIFRETLW